MVSCFHKTNENVTSRTQQPTHTASASLTAARAACVVMVDHRRTLERFFTNCAESVLLLNHRLKLVLAKSESRIARVLLGALLIGTRPRGSRYRVTGSTPGLTTIPRRSFLGKIFEVFFYLTSSARFHVSILSYFGNQCPRWVSIPLPRLKRALLSRFSYGGIRRGLYFPTPPAVHTGFLACNAVTRPYHCRPRGIRTHIPLRKREE